MRYIPITPEDQSKMLAEIGVESIRDLFPDIPAPLQSPDKLQLPEAVSEWKLNRIMNELSARNKHAASTPCYLGAGAYRHFIPAVVRALASRSEFVTAYTPYQPEISQGTLQALFEYQTMISQLTGMPVSNASVYDGAMATAEAALLALRTTRNPVIAVSQALSPGYLETLKTYTRNQTIELIELPLTASGTTDPDAIRALEQSKLAAVIVQSPNFFGVIEDIAGISEITAPLKALSIVVVSEALSLGLLKPPGEMGADIVCGEAQSFGLPVSFGGPLLGFFSCSQKLVRQAPGRLVGMTRDIDGKTGFVNTLATREQHIRRERATSNICTNQALCAVTAGIYLSTMGRTGLRNAALQNVKKAAYLKDEICALNGYKPLFNGPVFNEFAVTVPVSADSLNKKLLDNNIIGGLNLRKFFPELPESILFCATELNTRNEMDTLVRLLDKFGKELSE